jgi:drug/metabolite transporter (DMT)-like permease
MSDAPNLSTPNLSTKAGRKAWRHELRMVAVRPRRWGLWLLTIGVLLIVMPGALGVHDLMGWSPRFLGIVVALLSVPFLAVAAVLRRRYLNARRT